MARKIVAADSPERYGILVTHMDGKSGWLVGSDNNYLLFDSLKEATKALKKLKSNDNYTWNCDVTVAKFDK